MVLYQFAYCQAGYRNGAAGNTYGQFTGERGVRLLLVGHVFTIQDHVSVNDYGPIFPMDDLSNIVKIVRGQRGHGTIIMMTCNQGIGIVQILSIPHIPKDQHTVIVKNPQATLRLNTGIDPDGGCMNDGIFQREFVRSKAHLHPCFGNHGLIQWLDSQLHIHGGKGLFVLNG